MQLSSSSPQMISVGVGILLISGDGAHSKLTYGMGCRFAVIPVLPSNRFLIAELSLP